MGLSLAKHGAITFKDGKVQQGNLISRWFGSTNLLL